MNSEKDVKKAVKKILDQRGWFWWMPPANGFGKVGVSDFNAVKNGVFIAVETKFGKNKPTIHQLAFLESIAASRGYGFVVNEQRLEWLEAFLDAFDRAAEAVQDNKSLAPEDGAMMLNAIKVLTTELGNENATTPAVGKRSAERP